MKVAVVGAGDSGKAIKRALQATGAQVSLHSRRTGFDVLRDDGAAALSGADVIVEATGRFTTSKRVATDFFTRSTRAVSAAANALGARQSCCQSSTATFRRCRATATSRASARRSGLLKT